MTAKERLLQFIDYKGISKRQFYTSTGLSNGYLDNVGSLSTTKVELILSAYPELNGEWILNGKGGMLTEADSAELLLAPRKQLKNIGIPLVPVEALAGKAPGELQIRDSEVESRYLVPEFSKADFLIRVKGSSMYPKYSAGDVLACKKVSKADFIQWNKTYVIDTSQGVLVKRILKGTKPNHWILRSDNKDYQDIDVNSEKDIYHINLVIGVIRLE